MCGSELYEGAIFCGECGSAVEATPYLRAPVDDRRASDTSIVSGAVVDGPTARPVAPSMPAPVIEASALPDQGNLAEPVPTWVIAASTGERVIVAGSGLLGRKPVTPAGEQFDQLITIADPTRSVSKTHLEFGVEAGELWVLDRYSANGTAVVSPDGQRRVCEPGRRYRVARGSRVEIGDQHLTIG
ncbi:FHA domain-containing protein [Gryllotalpicola ginsengisoli]|uniref:FHA domain-containing protein n=1 Tax=Gryllotalpicola ginsengisoli TaxID=444608 RepID=UPI0003B3B346|nr:FHA domain-containing protein [Gryllotalpicola ginsengisoli]